MNDGENPVIEKFVFKFCSENCSLTVYTRPHGHFMATAGGLYTPLSYEVLKTEEASKELLRALVKSNQIPVEIGDELYRKIARSKWPITMLGSNKPTTNRRKK